MGALFDLWPFGARREKRYANNVRIGLGANLYDLYCADPGGLIGHIAQDKPIRGSQHAEIARWNREAAPWGLHATVRDLGTAGAGVVEIGEPDGVPGWIAYPVAQGWQLDEFDGDSRRYPSLASVLHAIADV